MQLSFNELWLKLTKPHTSLASNTDRVRAQALASVLVVIFVIAMLFEIIAITLNLTTTEFVATISLSSLIL